MDNYQLQALRLAHQLTERQLGERLGTTQQTAHRWIAGDSRIPQSTAKLIEHEFGDGSRGSAVAGAKAKVQQFWRKLTIESPVSELALVSVGAYAVVIEPSRSDLFAIQPYSEWEDMHVYSGDTCGLIHVPLELTTQLVQKLGREDIANDLHQLIVDQESDDLGLVLARIVGSLEQLEMLKYDIWDSLTDAIAISLGSGEMNEDQAA